MTDTALLDVRNLSAGYGGMLALRGVSLEVRPGEIVAILGSNGAGKTTLLRTLSRIVSASTGSVAFKGHETSGLTAEQVFALGLVQVPEGRQLFDRMTVQDNLLMGANRRHDKAAVAGDLERLYALFPPLRERRRRPAGSMSGGEQQMCAIARALMARPALLMVDEMSLGLAPVVVDQLMGILHEVRHQGVTVLLVEQDAELALAAADRGYVLETGQVVRDGTAQALLNDPAVRHAYLGL